MNNIYKILESFNAVANEGRMKDLYTELEELEPKIMRLKNTYMNKGMEPEEAQDAACEKLGCDPEMFDEYLTMKDEELDEATGSAAEPFYEMQDMYAGGECPSKPHETIIDELVEYLNDKQLEDFVHKFRVRHMDLGDEMFKEADVDENAFNQAAAAAARAGKDSFEFGGKTHKTTMKKDVAHKLDDDVQTEGRLKDKMIGDSEKMTKKEFAKKYGKEAADEMFDESINEAVTDKVIFNAEDGGILVSVGGKPVGWAGHPKELAQTLSKMGVDANTPMFHSSDVDFASEEGFDSDDGAHDFIDTALGMMGLSESSCKRMEESDDKDEGEYDREGEMADNQLDTVHDAAQELQDIIDADDNLPEWVQSKITKAMDYLDTARDYMKSKEDDDDVEVEVDETTTAGSVAPSTDAKPSGNFGKSVYESAFNEKLTLTESVSISTSDSTEGQPTVSVTATDEDAAALSKLLQMAGLGSSGYNETCPGCGTSPCGCGEAVEEDLANAPEEEYQTTDYMQNTVAGGVNGPKRQINPNNPGDNPLAMKGIANNTLNLGEEAEKVAEQRFTKLWDLYKEFK